MHILGLFLTTIYFFGLVFGWGFLPPGSIAEGATGRFQVTDDGGGFSFPYTMTVLKQVPNANDEQVGLVLTNGNETVFYWECNQSAGTTLRFRLVSSANVNAATSRYITPSAQAVASSVSVQSIASMSSKYAATATQTTGTPTSTVGASQGDTKTAPVGAIVGGIIGGIVVLLVVAFMAFRFHKSRKPEPVPEVTEHATVVPFGYHPQSSAPPLGYVTQSEPSELPPQYSPRYDDAESESYFTSSGPSVVGGPSIETVPPPGRRGKTGYAPVSARPY